MKKLNIAILGGTHGNEFVGVEVVRTVETNPPTNPLHHYQTFIANPLAHQRQLRFIDTDLNRAFGTNSKPLGYEKERSLELKDEIVGNFDYLIDLHTTTTNMGLTLLLNHGDDLSWRTACYLQHHFPEIKIIRGEKMVPECPYTAGMTSSGITIEVGPVPHNVINGDMVLKVRKMVDLLLNFDPEIKMDFPPTSYFQAVGEISFPNDKSTKWYIHPDRDGHDFIPITKGDPLFININGETIDYEGNETLYPYFVNEAAYQYQNLAMSTAKLIAP